MKKRLLCLALTCILAFASPILIAYSDASAPAAEEQEVYDAGEISFGVLMLRGEGGAYAKIDFVYVNGTDITAENGAAVVDAMRPAGFPRMQLPYDYTRMSSQKYFVATCSDSDALGRLVRSFDDNEPVSVLPDEVSGGDVSSADASPSDIPEAFPEGEPAGSSSDSRAPDLSTGDATSETLSDSSSATDAAHPASDADKAASGSDGGEEDSELSIKRLLDGAQYYSAAATLEETISTVFPEFYFSAAMPVKIEPDDEGGYELSGNELTASVIITTQPQYTQLEINGEVYNVLLIGGESTRYTVKKFEISGMAGESVSPPVTTTTTTTTTTTAATTTTTATETTPTDAPTTTTSAPTTAATTTTAAAITTTTTTTSRATTTTTTRATTTTTTRATTATTAATSPSGTATGYVSTRSLDLRVRKGPSLGSAVITCIPKGTVVTILALEEEEWYYVRLADGTLGYVYSYYITIRD